MMIVDIHTHVGRTKYGDLTINAERIITECDAAGVDKAVLIPTTSSGVIAPAEDMAREAKKAPDRFVFFAGVDPKRSDAVEKLEEAVVKFGAKGLKIHPTFLGLAADDERVYPLIEKSIELKIPVMFHSGEGPWALPWQIGLVAMDFPKATIIMAHMGLNSLCYTDAAIKMAKKAPNLILETTGVVFDHPIAVAVNTIGADRVIFGSDCPINNQIHEMKKIEVAKISDEAKRKILGENIARILGLWGY